MTRPPAKESAPRTTYMETHVPNAIERCEACGDEFAEPQGGAHPRHSERCDGSRCATDCPQPCGPVTSIALLAARQEVAELREALRAAERERDEARHELDDTKARLDICQDRAMHYTCDDCAERDAQVAALREALTGAVDCEITTSDGDVVAGLCASHRAEAQIALKDTSAAGAAFVRQTREQARREALENAARAIEGQVGVEPNMQAAYARVVRALAAQAPEAGT